MADNRFLSVGGIVIRNNKVLLVRQAYGSAKGLLVIPSGYLSEGEMPDKALEREIFQVNRLPIVMKPVKHCF